MTAPCAAVVRAARCAGRITRNASRGGDPASEGLDGLRGRLGEYVELGAKFTKWRAVIAIGEGIPSEGCVAANAELLARFAALSQEAGLVPIVEPEVLMDGDHTIQRCYEVTVRTLAGCSARCAATGSGWRGCCSSRTWWCPAASAPSRLGSTRSPTRRSRACERWCRRRCRASCSPVGGQSDEAATAHLNAMNRLGPQPWQLSFSYGRALQAPVLEAWKGEAGNGPAAQRAFLHRATLNGAARSGDYRPEMEHRA
jgi:fructose-bisphosphate aldolase, class I